MLEKFTLIFFSRVSVPRRYLFILSLFLILANNGVAQRYLVLLSSVNIDEIKSQSYWHQRLYRNYFRKMTNIIKDFDLPHIEGENIIPVVIHQASSYELWSLLKNPEVVGLIWISHGLRSAQGQDPSHLIATSAITDHNGFDVSSIFTEAHPGLKYLAVISCYSEKILGSDFRSANFQTAHPALKIHLTKALTDAHKELQTVLREFKSHISEKDSTAVTNSFDSSNSQQPTSSKNLSSEHHLSIEFKLTREFPDYDPEVSIDSPALVIKVSGPQTQDKAKIIGVIPPIQNSSLDKNPTNELLFHFTISSLKCLPHSSKKTIIKIVLSPGNLVDKANKIKLNYGKIKLELPGASEVQKMNAVRPFAYGTRDKIFYVDLSYFLNRCE